MSALALVSADEHHEEVELGNPSDHLQSADSNESANSKPRRGPATIAAVFPLNRFGDTELQRPLVVSVEYDDTDIVMCHGKLRIWGAGKDVYEAYEDFKRSFLEIVRSYSETPPEQMTPGAVAYLKDLRSYLP